MSGSPSKFGFTARPRLDEGASELVHRCSEALLHALLLPLIAGQHGRMRTEPYPSWDYFPKNARPPGWVEPFVANVRAVEESISTVERKTGLDSDRVLQQLAAGLRELGFSVESGKKASDRIRRSVLFGSNGQEEVSYEIDAFHDAHGIVVEVEAGRGAWQRHLPGHYPVQPDC